MSGFTMRLRRATGAYMPTPPPVDENPLVIQQYGVTFEFDSSYPSGQFINGDWWVCPQAPGGQVTITTISPTYDSGQTTNGFQVNPTSMTTQGYDGRVLPGWTPGLVPSLPLSVGGNTSVVKAVSAPGAGGTSPDHLPSLQTAVVLTILDQPPTLPAQTFRPPYYGTYKPLYTTADLLESRLPSLAPVGNPPTIEWVRDRFQRVQLDQYFQYNARYMHPADNFRATPGIGDISNYGADLARDNNTAILRLMLNDVTWSAKQVALANVLQAGIDWFGIVNAGGGWATNGGHAMGRKPVIFFTAMMFDSAEMKASIAAPTKDKLCEFDYVNYSAIAGRPLWGYQSANPNDYWDRLDTGSGRRDLADPTLQIDGGDNPSAGYQAISTGTFSETALIVHLMNGVDVWAHDDFLDYVDRWRTFGAWTQPDTESSRRPAFWANHGVANESYRNPFLVAMWNTYR